MLAAALLVVGGGATTTAEELVGVEAEVAVVAAAELLDTADMMMRSSIFNSYFVTLADFLLLHRLLSHHDEKRGR